MVKMAKWSSEEFQEVSEFEVSCESPNAICQTFSFALLSSDAVPFCFHFCSLARSRLDCSCSISALAQSFSHVDHLLVRPVPHGPYSISALAKCHTCDEMDQAFPLHFCILQAIKNWTVGRPGNVARVGTLIVQVCSIIEPHLHEKGRSRC